VVQAWLNERGSKARFQRIRECVPVRFNEGCTSSQVNTFVNTLRLFRIGLSWGGLTSLVMA
jgi:cystathionine beta-lyase/cystathionine gamma-synthase